MTITKSVAIVCDETEGGLLAGGTTGITVNVAATDNVILRGLDIDGIGTGVNGIDIVGTGTVLVRNTKIRRFAGNGINLDGTANAKVLVQDSIIEFNGGGVNVQGQGGAVNTAIIDHTTINTNNANFAAQAATGGALFISASFLVGSGPKVVLSGGGTFTSYGNNVIRGASAPPTTTLSLQ